jgi:predicted transcriptional regulator
MTFNRSPQELSEALRGARKKLCLTQPQPQSALAAGVGVRFIVDLEAGKPTLRLENILRLINGFCRINCERTRFSRWTLHHPYAGRICPASA